MTPIKPHNPLPDELADSIYKHASNSSTTNSEPTNEVKDWVGEAIDPNWVPRATELKPIKLGPSSMKIDPKWIALTDELPEHGTNCIVGNVNRRDPDNPILGEKWVTAVFVDRQRRMDEIYADAEKTGRPILFKAPMVGPRFVFEINGLFNELSDFTHWWPIPKPFTEHPV